MWAIQTRFFCYSVLVCKSDSLQMVGTLRVPFTVQHESVASITTLYFVQTPIYSE